MLRFRSECKIIYPNDEDDEGKGRKGDKWWSGADKNVIKDDKKRIQLLFAQEGGDESEEFKGEEMKGEFLQVKTRKKEDRMRASASAYE